MRIAILGARGFLGQNLGPLLVSQGYEVVGYVLNPDFGKDLGFECKSVTELLSSPIIGNSSYDVTINLAARRSTRNQRFTEAEVNEFTYEIPKEFILRTAGPQTTVLNASTYIQNFAGETSRTVDSYGAAKEKLSQFLEHQSLVSRFRTRDLFFFTLYGIGDRPNHLVPLLLNAARSGKQIALSPGDQLMNLLYIDDAAQNILNCISSVSDLFYSKSHVWAENYFTVKQLVSTIESTIGEKINCDWGSREYAGHEMMNPWPIPMKQLANFVAPTALANGISKIWDSIQNEAN
jgi:nucleoside-diphosphate-sugar epimerase